jgi:ketosteroid isomerase-like protein
MGARLAALREAEQALYRAQVAKDFPALERLLAADLVYVHSTAVAETKAQYLAGLAEALYDYQSIASRDTRMRVHGDVALIDGTCTMHVGRQGQAFETIHLLFVLAWVFEADEWRLVHRHATRMPARGN